MEKQRKKVEVRSGKSNVPHPIDEVLNWGEAIVMFWRSLFPKWRKK